MFMLPLPLTLLGLLGLYIATHICRTKRRKKTLVCPLGHHCDAVVHSKYNAMFGIPNEVLGAGYYMLVIVASLLLWRDVHTVGSVALFPTLLVLSTLALAYSVVLTYIQIFILRHYCTWCLASAGVNVLIVVAEAFAIF